MIAVTNSFSVLVPGLGMRINSAPIGFCSVSLIKTASGKTVLVDSGVHQTRELLLSGLAEHDLSPSDVDYVVVTHLHFDHCENTHLFTGAEVIVHEDEVSECERFPDRDRYVADYWRRELSRCRVRLMSDGEVELEDGVRIVHAPGHRHGQLIVIAPTTEGATVFSSDAARNARELLEGLSVVSDPAMVDASRRSIELIRSAAEVVVPGHDRVMRMRDGVPYWQEDQQLNVRIY